ncbi:MAG: glycerophosphodiester phosphodiesterase [Burkholderiales bacterium]
MMRLLLKVGAVLLASLITAHLVLAALVKPVPQHPFWATATGPRVIAHRGGRGLWPENTLYAFRKATDLGADVLEMDIRQTADGVLVVLHDETVDRTTDGSGPVAALTLSRLHALDAGYRWSLDGGKTHPHRGQGLTVPGLREVFSALPQARMNLEIKTRDAALSKPLCELIREHRMEQRVVVASFGQDGMDAFRAACPGVATAATAEETRRLFRLTALFLDPLFEPRAEALQVPERLRNLEVLTPGFVRAARRLNLKIDVWTVNDPEDMKRLIALPVDGIMTDYPDRMLALRGK